MTSWKDEGIRTSWGWGRKYYEEQARFRLARGRGFSPGEEMGRRQGGRERWPRAGTLSSEEGGVRASIIGGV
jgi:hypothetical protein